MTELISRTPQFTLSTTHSKRLKIKDLCTNKFQTLEDETGGIIPVIPVMPKNASAVQHNTEMSQDMDIPLKDSEDQLSYLMRYFFF